MKELANRIIIILLLVVSGIQYIAAQDAAMVRGKVFSAVDGPLPGVTVMEVDPSNRNVTSTITDANGNFSLKIKNPSNKLRFKYVGYKLQEQSIGSKRTFNVEMQDATTMSEVVVKIKKPLNTNGLAISQKEVSQAMQTISSKEFEGLSVSSVDDALQGKVSGLDIVGNSGDLGSGSSMRIRGITSINGNSEPLIVVNGVIFTAQTDNFDFTTANQEQFANLLSVNVDDIDNITVLKDAASTAIYGAQGANGVIQINTKRGAMGKTKVSYTYRYSGAWQPKGIKMLSGDDYTMMMKESFFNPSQNDNASNIPEFNYDKNFSEYEQYNNNTDWIKAVSQYGETHDHSIQLSGGGDKARFMVSAGYYKQTGIVIGQGMSRYTSRLSLDYNVSDRIKFTSDFSFTYYDNQQNYTIPYSLNDGIMAIAYRKMPNLSIYQQNADGSDTKQYYKMLPSVSSQLFTQRLMYNPVALAMLAMNNSKSARVIPIFRLQYDLLDPNNTQSSRLFYRGYVSFDVTNSSGNSYLPKELNSSNSADNQSSSYDKRNLAISSEHNMTFIPKFSNADHSLMLYANAYLYSSTERSQSIKSSGAPSGSITSPTTDVFVSEFSSGPGQGRSLRFNFVSHYAYKEKYIADLSVTRYGCTKFGDDRKWGTFPGVSFAWNVADEEFMKPVHGWLSTLKIRPSWGLAGNEPDVQNMDKSMYSSYGSYIGSPAFYPENIKLTGLKWETNTQFNYGFDFGINDDAYMVYFDSYYKRISDLLFYNQAIPTTSGYSLLKAHNAGVMDNVGWELNLNADKLVKIGDFNMGITLNFSNYVNTIVALDEYVLGSKNSPFDGFNGSYLTRIQEHNAYGSIYGFRYKGVYQYTDYVEGRNGTSPYAHDAEGKIIRDGNGEPVRMVFNYDPKNNTTPYQFKGGDAIYEDINHDGNINELDIVYLGNSNPLFNGGITLRFKYKSLSMNLFANYRVGGKIVNVARMNAENMYSGFNQCASVNWRWRKEGDITTIPRALNGSAGSMLAGYNWLGSDRYVEDGSFLRAKNLQINYALPAKLLKPYRLSGMTLYMTMNNLFVLTKYSGVDPEVGLNTMSISYDSSQTPRSKSFTAGVTVSF